MQPEAQCRTILSTICAAGCYLERTLCFQYLSSLPELTCLLETTKEIDRVYPTVFVFIFLELEATLWCTHVWLGNVSCHPNQIFSV